MNLPREFGVDAANINSKWIENIYENIKKIEEFERLAREGCTSIFDYVQIPMNDRNMFLVEIQYKNLKLLLNEFILVIPDINPVIGETESGEFMQLLEKLSKVMEDKKNIIRYFRSDVQNKITDAELTDSFYTMLKILHDLRVKLILVLKNILYREESKVGRQR